MTHSIEWVKDKEYPEIIGVYADETRVGWMAKRPSYCDRGHWEVNIQYSLKYSNIEIHQIDDADRFPRYYMSKSVAISETEAFLRWRLWKEKTNYDQETCLSGES